MHVGRPIESMQRAGARFPRHLQRQLGALIHTGSSNIAAAAHPAVALCWSTVNPTNNHPNTSVGWQPVVATTRRTSLSRTDPPQPFGGNFPRYVINALGNCNETQAPSAAQTHRHIHTCAGAALSSDSPTSSATPTPAEGSTDDPSELLNQLVNYERIGIPDAAGTASSSAFDLSRMRRLLAALGDPHMQLQAVHVAGSKGMVSGSSRLRHRGAGTREQ